MMQAITEQGAEVRRLLTHERRAEEWSRIKKTWITWAGCAVIVTAALLTHKLLSIWMVLELKGVTR